MSTVVVTGAAGRVGRSLMNALAEAGYKTRGVDRRPSEARATDVVTDLSDPEATRDAVVGADVIVHLAALMSWRDEDATAVFAANVASTFNLLEAAKSVGIKHVILASSGEVYPEMAPRFLPITEQHPTEPTSYYGMTKLVDEQMLWFYARKYRIEATVLRFPHTQDASELLDPESFFCGPRFFLQRKIVQQRVLGNERAVAALEPYDDGRDLLILSRSEDAQPYCMPICDTRDTVAGILLAVSKPSARGQTIALGPAEPFRFDAVVPRMSEAIGLEYVDVCLPGKGTNYTVDIRKARDLLGYMPQHGVDEMLSEAAAAYQHRVANAGPPSGTREEHQCSE